MKSLIRLIRSVGLAALLAATLQSAFAFRVVGYFPSWQGSVSAIQYSKVTNINYAFLLPNSNGSLQTIDNASKLSSLVSTAHSNGVKVGISVGGWNNGDDSAFVSLAGNSTYRTSFVNNVINFVTQYGLDGVDIDWEYPSSSSESSSYNALMSALSSALHSRGKTLTAAVVAYGSTGDYISSTAFGYVDWLNIMDYDNTNGVGQSTYSSAGTALDYWVGTRGLPASKAMLGVPFYSDPSDYSFATLLSKGADPYSDSWGSEGYNGITTIQNKTNLCFDRAIGGIMIWELSQDATGQYSLLSAIDTVVKQRTGSGGGGTFSGWYKIVDRNSTKVAAVQSASTSNGAAVILYTFGTAQNDQWSLVATDSGYYKIVNRKSGLVMAVQSASTASGAAVIQWSFGSAQNDQWKPVALSGGYYKLVNRHSGLVLDVKAGGTSNGTPFDQATSNGANYQQFQLVSTP
jgi:chitinase